MAKPKVNAARRAAFREIARNIISDDRAARKLGISQNTIGAIERALLKAFQEGYVAANTPEPDEPPLTWEQLPSRSRDTLYSMTLSFSNFMRKATYVPDQIECFDDQGKRRWRLSSDRNARDSRSIADGSVAPLIKLELIEPVDPNSNLYRLTVKGDAICRDYWARSDQNDPSLPKMSLR